MWSLEVLTTILVCLRSKSRPWNLKYENLKRENGRSLLQRKRLDRRSCPDCKRLMLVKDTRVCKDVADGFVSIEMRKGKGDEDLHVDVEVTNVRSSPSFQ